MLTVVLIVLVVSIHAVGTNASQTPRSYVDCKINMANLRICRRDLLGLLNVHNLTGMDKALALHALDNHAESVECIETQLNLKRGPPSMSLSVCSSLCQASIHLGFEQKAQKSLFPLETWLAFLSDSQSQAQKYGCEFDFLQFSLLIKVVQLLKLLQASTSPSKDMIQQIKEMQSSLFKHVNQSPTYVRTTPRYVITRNIERLEDCGTEFFNPLSCAGYHSQLPFWNANSKRGDWYEQLPTYRRFGGAVLHECTGVFSVTAEHPKRAQIIWNDIPVGLPKYFPDKLPRISDGVEVNFFLAVKATGLWALGVARASPRHAI